MIIEVICHEIEKYRREIDVYALCFDPANESFSMSYCMGDMWGIELKCPLAIRPTSLTFQSGRVSVRFERQEDADAFAAWLVEGEEKVREGFKTMRG
jgi:hypothetical protein